MGRAVTYRKSSGSRKKYKNKEGPLENAINSYLQNLGYVDGEDYKRNKTFIPGRRFSGDFVFEDLKLVIEIDGGEYTGQGHVSGSGYTSDREKDALALLCGWLIVRVSGSQVNGKDVESYNKSQKRKDRKKRYNTAQVIIEQALNFRKANMDLYNRMEYAPISDFRELSDSS